MQTLEQIQVVFARTDPRFVGVDLSAYPDIDGLPNCQWLLCDMSGLKPVIKGVSKRPFYGPEASGHSATIAALLDEYATKIKNLELL